VAEQDTLQCPADLVLSLAIVGSRYALDGLVAQCEGLLRTALDQENCLYVLQVGAGAGEGGGTRIMIHDRSMIIFIVDFLIVDLVINGACVGRESILVLVLGACLAGSGRFGRRVLSGARLVWQVADTYSLTPLKEMALSVVMRHYGETGVPEGALPPELAEEVSFPEIRRTLTFLFI
jgi:hypothetical protein